VIEDCAPALYSADEQGRPLGTIGDAGAFSFMKTLPVPDGGALILNSTPAQGGRPTGSDPQSPTTRAVLRRVKSLAEEGGLHRAPRLTKSLRRIANPLIRATRPRGAPALPLTAIDEGDPRYRDAVREHIELKPSQVSWSISSLARHLFERTPHHLVPLRRRRNFEVLASNLPVLSGVRPMFPTLPGGCCPLCFPLVLDEPDDFYRFLRDRGIHTQRTWCYVHEGMRDLPFPFENWLRSHVVSLPIHHQLDEEDMRYMLDVIDEWHRTEAF
jgi:dTDP-4-amino-4,6-dideoxygalactose transaminase